MLIKLSCIVDTGIDKYSAPMVTPEYLWRGWWLGRDTLKYTFFMSDLQS